MHDQLRGNEVHRHDRAEMWLLLTPAQLDLTVGRKPTKASRLMEAQDVECVTCMSILAQVIMGAWTRLMAMTSIP